MSACGTERKIPVQPGPFRGRGGRRGGAPDLLTHLAPFRGRIFIMPDSAGRDRRISLSGVSVFDDRSGAFSGYRGTGTDVTREHDAEQRVMSTRKVLQHSLEELRNRNL